jgi:hypothetical protein
VVAVGGGALTDLAGFVAATMAASRPCSSHHAPRRDRRRHRQEGRDQRRREGRAGVFRHPVRGGRPRHPRVSAPTAGPRGVRRGPQGGPRPEIPTSSSSSSGLWALDAPLGKVVDRRLQLNRRGVVRLRAGAAGGLNYGHTVGHAVEVATSISRQAVSVGMVAAAHSRDDHRLRVPGAAQYHRVQALPVVAPPVSRRRIEELMSLDKKRDEAQAAPSCSRTSASQRSSTPTRLPYEQPWRRSALRSEGDDLDQRCQAGDGAQPSRWAVPGRQYQHVKPGKGKAFVKMKLKNLGTGAVLEKTFRADEDAEGDDRSSRLPIPLPRRPRVPFMDGQTYDSSLCRWRPWPTASPPHRRCHGAPGPLRRQPDRDRGFR